MAADLCDPSAFHTMYRGGDPAESLCAGCRRGKAQPGRGVPRQRNAVYHPSYFKHDLLWIQRHILPERFPDESTILSAGQGSFSGALSSMLYDRQYHDKQSRGLRMTCTLRM